MRARILADTIELLTRHPGRKPTTYQVAEHAHVSIGTVYRYFVDIDAIIGELRMAAVHDITTRLATGVGRALDLDPADAMVTVVETLTSAFEEHDAILRISLADGGSELGSEWKEVEGPLVPLARILPTRLRPDLDDSDLDDLTFLTMGAAASLCLRIALLRPEHANRSTLVRTASRMLLAAFDREV